MPQRTYLALADGRDLPPPGARVRVSGTTTTVAAGAAEAGSNRQANAVTGLTGAVGGTGTSRSTLMASDIVPLAVAPSTPPLKRMNVAAFLLSVCGKPAPVTIAVSAARNALCTV